MPKAIFITEANKNQVADQMSNLSREEVSDYVDLWLLSSFGENAFFRGTLTDIDFKAQYQRLGRLRNGWYEVGKK